MGARGATAFQASIGVGISIPMASVCRAVITGANNLRFIGAMEDFLFGIDQLFVMQTQQPGQFMH